MENNENNKNNVKNKTKKTTVSSSKKNKNMDARKLVLYLLLIIVLALVILLIVVNVKKNNKNSVDSNLENNTQNSNEIYIDSRNISELDFNQIALKKEGENYIVTSEVINNTAEEKGGFNLQIVIKNENNEALLTLGDFVPKLQSTEKYNINTAVQFDLSQAKDIEIINIDEVNSSEEKE